MKQTAQAAVQNHRSALLKLSHDIHDHPETNFQEVKASAWVADLLENNGFSVDRGVADLPTAFRASVGTGELNIGICAEYDALPNIGHACGHNIIASAAVGAALAIAPLVDELNMTITVLGTPAEEGGGGKVFMLQRGAFDGLHASMMVHPARIERDEMPTLATSQYIVEYFGKSSHAAAAPERGISASAAQALAQVGVGMLREHFEASDRVHGIVTKGGDAPNIVPEYSKSAWFIRAATATRRDELEQRMMNVFRGAALMTGCEVKLSRESPSLTEVKSDRQMASFWTQNAAELGRTVLPVQPEDGAASTDMGNVTYAMPSIHPFIALESGNANIHEAEFAKAAGEKTGEEATLFGAAAMAMTIIDLATDATARESLLAKTFVASELSDADAKLVLSVGWDTPVN